MFVSPYVKSVGCLGCAHVEKDRLASAHRQCRPTISPTLDWVLDVVVCVLLGLISRRSSRRVAKEGLTKRFSKWCFTTGKRPSEVEVLVGTNYNDEAWLARQRMRPRTTSGLQRKIKWNISALISMIFLCSPGSCSRRIRVAPATLHHVFVPDEHLNLRRPLARREAPFEISRHPSLGDLSTSASKSTPINAHNDGSKPQST